VGWPRRASRARQDAGDDGMGWNGQRRKHDGIGSKLEGDERIGLSWAGLSFRPASIGLAPIIHLAVTHFILLALLDSSKPTSPAATVRIPSFSLSVRVKRPVLVSRILVVHFKS
jgi:hypothetical protein